MSVVSEATDKAAASYRNAARGLEMTMQSLSDCQSALEGLLRLNLDAGVREHLETALGALQRAGGGLVQADAEMVNVGIPLVTAQASVGAITERKRLKQVERPERQHWEDF